MGQPHGTPGFLQPPGGMCWRFEDCRLNEIEWAPLMSNGAFPDPIHTLKGGIGRTVLILLFEQRFTKP